MKLQGLARSLAFATVLGASLVALPTTAFAAATGGGSCPDGYEPWAYASGSTNVGWMNHTPSNGLATATHWAEGECSQAWATVGVNPTAGMSVNVYWGASNTWEYTCIACRHSIVQNLNHPFYDFVIDIGSAGGIGGQAGGGIAIGVELRPVKDDIGYGYFVDVLRERDIVQVIVNPMSGETQLIKGRPVSPR